MKPIGRNTATIDSVVASTARPISLRAVQRRVVRGLAHLHVAHDVLAHHDRVVDQQAHAQAQRHQRDGVDREAEHVHEQEGADQRDRQRQAGDDGASASC
jgi:hypothetical protein